MVAASMDLIDRSGLDALSLPALAEELGVRAPSLYHWFKDKAEILGEVARAVILDTPYPRRRADSQWVDWMVDLCVNFRRSILRHRHAAPLLLHYLPRDVLVSRYEYSAVKLARAGVPQHLYMVILDGCEKLAIGSGLTEAMQPVDRSAATFWALDPIRQPALAAAVAADASMAEELFREEVRRFLLGCLDSAGAAPPADGTAYPNATS